MKRMKTIATVMFGLALLGSLIAWPFKNGFMGGLLFAAFEAALVGALADWFAVVALFRHPLGLKFIPHTAIIPNNRDRIIDGIVAIVEKDWLSLDFIRSKVMAYPVIDGIASALETDAGRQGVERLAQSVIIHMIKDIKPEDAARFSHLMLAENIDRIKISSRLAESLESSLKRLFGEDVIRMMLDWAIASTRGEEFERVIYRTLKRAAADYSNQGNFMRRLGKGLGESLDIFNYEEAAAVLTGRINHILIEMKDPDNHYHTRIKMELENLKISDPASISDSLSDVLKHIIGTDAGLAATAELFAAVKAQILDASNEKIPIVHYLTTMSLQQFNSIRQDEVRKAALEGWIKAELMGLLERYHTVIGMIVREKLDSLNDAGLVQSLEDKVGDDLQWIRINGTVIGAVVGIVQYLVLHWL